MLNINSIISFFLKKEKNPINPEDYGWTKVYEDYYEKESYFLYKSHSGWVLDKTPKHAPGVVRRFNNPLCLHDMEESNSFVKNVPNPSRQTK